MKTSNKLLLGFFGLVVVSLVIANIAIKSEINKTPRANSQIEINKIMSSYLLINNSKVLLSMNRNT
ncbi:MAG TPA: hypothetical protein VJ602_12285, partial [Paludibacter sp.]|nr:hypothetical protein [Paludibacter sp.]